MSKFIVLALSLLSFNAAHATSLHPCTPIVQAQDTHISCRAGAKYYSITIETLMSPPNCQGDEHYEYDTAKVEISTKSGKSLGVLTIHNGDFSYSLGVGGSGASFTSEKNGLKLDDCVTPMNGGFSVGN